VRGLVGVLGIVSSVRGKPAAITSDVLQILGRYAWYDTSKARTELGWTSRTLRETLTDTIQWLRSQPAAAPRAAV
jgi:dihydroflavonol-4-reductase